MLENAMTLPASGTAEEILARFAAGSRIQSEQALQTGKPEAREGLYHLVTFSLGGEQYGVGIESVQEIIRATEITAVPGAADHIRGVINLRGKIIPVVDLRKRFGMPGVAALEAERIIVVELGDKRLGMLVDGVSQVVKIAAAQVEDMPEEATARQERYIRGIGKMENRLVMILDTSRSLLQSMVSSAPSRSGAL